MSVDLQAPVLDPGGQAPAHTLFLFGATGDLAQRKLLPALHSLFVDKRLPERFVVIGVARADLTDETFRSLVREAALRFGRNADAGEDWPAFLRHFHYVQADARRPEDFARLRARAESLETEHGLPGHRLFYLALAPDFFAPTARALGESGLTACRGWRRLVIEKPFGHDQQSAIALNDALRKVFEEDEIYRIDHYLGKEMVQNIEVLRFANSVFEPLWNNRAIANVQITSSETVGVENRAGYYEAAGALRDMVQNHMLQMVMMVAMEPPSRLKMEAIRDEKVKVLRSLRRYSPEEAVHHVVRGQYTAGRIQGQDVSGYREEPGVAAGSNTETFVAARLYIDNFRWAGVPFYLRTGKRMAAKATEIVIQFRDMPKDLYFNTGGRLGPNLLVIRVNPQEGVYIQLNAKHPGTDERIVPIAMEFSQAPDRSPESYERLLWDAMQGDSTFFTRWDEVSLAWKFVDPIAAAFTRPDTPLHPYPAGSWGPTASDRLLAEDGFRWWPVQGQDTPVDETGPEHHQARPVGV
ncbi:glucose-6-phosphate dehydrogenase [Alicyclobacillus macrosporangiidus]|uniref:Glucose-6-phosphate 1-dehydrogenase n=1 Tax=Alicyclobacillus macrosporangiidus TaxID=392015 RepID=A0A1I7FGN9_9BACL|nr:glucose-6-phosphate dehydrogenase [Alicyclobacillus macrosporangiidus]SFU35383.1 glucose-6-phosphate 1-dehydrogenase [Alicyclobacillus macrosporangiidus]